MRQEEMTQRELLVEEIPSHVLELAPKLPGCAGWLLLHLARYHHLRHHRGQLMMVLDKSEAAVRRGVAELAKQNLCSVDSEGRVQFTPEGFLR